MFTDLIIFGFDLKNRTMANGENKIIRRRLANAYLSTVISISLVLLLVGVASRLLVNAKSVSDYFKENMQVSVLMKQEVTEKQAKEYQSELNAMPYIHSTEFISKSRGENEMAQMLGKDFLNVVATSPIPISIDVTLKANYVSPDSIAVVKKAISASPMVDEVVYQQSLVDALNANLRKISLVLFIFIALLLFISFVLINNTVRLNVFSRRFTIHTMKLVGATRSFIRAPFVRDAVLQGLVASAIAAGALAAIMAAARHSFSQLFAIFDKWMLPAVMALMVVCGVLICVVSTYFVVNKLVAMTKDDLYF